MRSEPDDGPGGELELLQGALTKPNGRQTSPASSSFSTGRLVSERAHARPIAFEGKYLTPPPSPNESLVSDSKSSALKERRAEAAEHEEPQPRGGAAEIVDHVAVQLPDGHREERRGPGIRADLLRRRLLRPQHFRTPVRRERTRALNAHVSPPRTSS